MKKEEIGKRAKIFGVALIILVLDQLVKLIVDSNMDIKQSIPLIKNVFHLTYIKNTGAGFGIFQGQNVLLIFIAVIILGAILFYYNKLPSKSIVYYSVGLIIGGTIGNIIDRIRLGFVIDFLDFRIWPAFNIADSAITIGAILLIIYIWKFEK